MLTSGATNLYGQDTAGLTITCGDSVQELGGERKMQNMRIREGNSGTFLCWNAQATGRKDEDKGIK
jgi:hypothetical protein